MNHKAKLGKTKHAKGIKKDHSKSSLKNAIKHVIDLQVHFRASEKLGKSMMKKADGKANGDRKAIYDIETLTKSKWAMFLNKSRHLEFTGIAFVIFETQEERNAVLAKFQSSKLAQIFQLMGINCKGNAIKKYHKKDFPEFANISVSEPPEPIDIYWENLGYNIHNTCKTNLINMIVTFLLFGIVVGLITLVRSSRFHYDKSQEAEH